MKPEDSDATPDEELRPSRHQRRQEAEGYAALADQLARGKPKDLPNPPFEGALRNAVMDARRFVKGARARQIRRLAQLLQEAGSVEMLQETLAGNTPEMRAQAARERINERWRQRLLDEGDGALTEFIQAHPHADRNQLRQLLRQASKSPPDTRSKKASTELLRSIRDILAAGEDTPAEA